MLGKDDGCFLGGITTDSTPRRPRANSHYLGELAHNPHKGNQHQHSEVKFIIEHISSRPEVIFCHPTIVRLRTQTHDMLLSLSRRHTLSQFAKIFGSESASSRHVTFD